MKTGSMSTETNWLKLVAPHVSLPSNIAFDLVVESPQIGFGSSGDVKRVTLPCGTAMALKVHMSLSSEPPQDMRIERSIYEHLGCLAKPLRPLTPELLYFGSIKPWFAIGTTFLNGYSLEFGLMSEAQVAACSASLDLLHGVSVLHGDIRGKHSRYHSWYHLSMFLYSHDSN